VASRLRPEIDFGNGGTLPPDILVTSQRPDLVLINCQTGSIIIFELTCLWDSNVDRSHEYKCNKYSALITDLMANFKVEL
jgi:hypothetical protein